MAFSFTNPFGSKFAVAALAVLIIAPAAAVFWFMSEAARTQEEAARHSVAEAFRGQLRLLRDRVDSTWRARAEALTSHRLQPPATRARQLRHDTGADAIVLFDAAGNRPIYPELLPLLRPEPFSETEVWDNALVLERDPATREAAAALWGQFAESSSDPLRAALATRNQIRCLLRLGRTQHALALIRAQASGPAALLKDASGRLLSADTQLLGLQLMTTAGPPPKPAVERLATLLGRENVMPASQRIFVMDELRKLAPEVPLYFSYDSDRLALQYAGAANPRPVAPGLQPTTEPDVWQMANGDTIALYRTPTITNIASDIVRSANPGGAVLFQLHPPAVAPERESVPIGPRLPGWNLALLTENHSHTVAAQRQRNRYFLFGSIVIGAILLAGSLAVRLVNTQLRLARLKTDLVAAVSHELRTPIASIGLLLENLLADAAPDPLTTREYLALIAGENDRLRRLVDNFLTFSRIERNRQRYRFEPITAAAIVNAAIRATHFPAVHIDIAPGLAPIRADRDALVTVLVNLLDNATKYSPAESPITLRVFPENESVVFSVADKGIGIPRREQRKVFRQFYQVDRRLARERGGCGLGLSIVDDLVRAHGGAVKLHSAEGEGSTFEVRIPRWREEEKVAV